MSCPLYINFTKHCIQKLPEIVEIGTYDYCFSDGYKMCPFNKIIAEKSPYCELIKNCGISFLEYFSYSKKVQMYELNSQNLLEYCLSDNKKKNLCFYKYGKKKEKISQKIYYLMAARLN